MGQAVYIGLQYMLYTMGQAVYIGLQYMLYTMGQAVYIGLQYMWVRLCAFVVYNGSSCVHWVTVHVI